MAKAASNGFVLLCGTAETEEPEDPRVLPGSKTIY